MRHINPVEELGGFPVDWELVKLPDVIYFQEGPGITSDKFRQEGVPFLNIRCFVNGRINRDACQYVSSHLANGPYKHFQLNEGDWVFSSSGTIGKIVSIGSEDLPILLNTSTIRFRSCNSERLENNYISIFLQSDYFSKQHRLQTQGSAQVNVGPTHLSLMYIPLPPKPEQTKIAEILSTVDRAIEQTEAIIAKQQRIKTGLMQDLLTHGIDEHGNLRSEETHEFKDSPLGRIPVEWDVNELGQTVVSAVDGPFGSNLKSDHYVDEPGVRVIRLGNIGNGKFLDQDKAWISNAHGRFLSRHAVQPLDLLIGSLGDERHPFGRACLYTDTIHEAVVKADVFRVRCKSDKFVHSFAVHLFNFPRWRQGLFALAQGVTRNRVNLTNMMLLQLPVPPISEQKAIVRIIESTDASLDELQRQLVKLRSLKTALMQDLLTGKKRVTTLLNDTRKLHHETTAFRN